jgi:hypothetical protein
MKVVFEGVRPEDAKHLAESDVFRNTMRFMEAGLVDGMARSAFGDLDTHHHLVLSLQSLRNIEKALNVLAEGDKVVDFNNNQANKVV